MRASRNSLRLPRSTDDQPLITANASQLQMPRQSNRLLDLTWTADYQRTEMTHLLLRPSVLQFQYGMISVRREKESSKASKAKAAVSNAKAGIPCHKRTNQKARGSFGRTFSSVLLWSRLHRNLLPSVAVVEANAIGLQQSVVHIWAADGRLWMEGRRPWRPMVGG